MQWENLKQNKCPVCFADLMFSESEEGSDFMMVIKCQRCTFKCNPDRMREICTSMVDKQIDKDYKGKKKSRFDL